MLSIKNIETWYDLIRALHGISFEINQGDIVALLGSNGAGKSTTLKTIMRLLDDDQPEKGSIEFMGKRIDRLDTEEIVRLGISYVPEGRGVFPKLSVAENLSLGAYTEKSAAEVRRRLDEMMQLFPVLRERSRQTAETLSGGEQQMLAIARGLMSRPKLLMLDEPSLGLSPLLTKEIFTIIQDINKKGVTILLVEQNVNMALKYSTYAFLMENGRIVRADKPEVLREDEDVKEFYLGIATEQSVKGYKRYRRKVRFR